MKTGITIFALAATVAALSTIPFTTALGAEAKKPAATQRIAPRVNTEAVMHKKCEGPNPAVIRLDVRKTVASGKGYLTASATVKNLGTRNFISGPNQAAANLEVYNKGLSGPAAYTRVGQRNIRRLDTGASIAVNGSRYEVPSFIEWGHRTATSGECQAEREVSAFISYDPDILTDNNPKNDDCNPNNNLKKQRVEFMVQCPW